jgi:hypothetical protein
MTQDHRLLPTTPFPMDKATKNLKDIPVLSALKTRQEIGSATWVEE